VSVRASEERAPRGVEPSPERAASSSTFIAPGATLGVLGGGQLGRMFVHAAQSMGYRTAVLDADPASPAGLVAHEHIRADYLDPAALARMAVRCSAITTEF
jgi:5-(carboxyamino)imidazole ribonucleotide synthase